MGSQSATSVPYDCDAVDILGVVDEATSGLELSPQHVGIFDAAGEIACVVAVFFVAFVLRHRLFGRRSLCGRRLSPSRPWEGAKEKQEPACFAKSVLANGHLLTNQSVLANGHLLTNQARDMGRRQDVEGLRRLVAELIGAGCALLPIARNRILATCVECNVFDQAEALVKHSCGEDDAQDVIAFNTLIRGYARVGGLRHCFRVAGSMRSLGLQPNAMTYGALLDACVRAGAMDRAEAVFEELRQTEEGANTVHCTTIIKGLVLQGRLDAAMGIFDRMKTSPASRPDPVTYLVLVAAYCDASRVPEALDLVEEMTALGLEVSESISNKLVSESCAEKGRWAPRVLGLVRRLRFQMPRRTLSMLNKALILGGHYDAAHGMLRAADGAEAKHFSHLALACIRGRRGEAAVEIYRTLARKLGEHGEVPDQATGSELVDRCVGCRMFGTACDLVEAISCAGGGLRESSAAALREAARRCGREHLLAAWPRAAAFP